MKKMFNIFKSRAGYVSVETVIVAGLIIALGAYAITQFYMTSQSTTEFSVDNVNKVFDITVDQTPIP